MTDYEIYYTYIDGVSFGLDLEDEKPICRIVVGWSGDRGFGQIEIRYKLLSGEYYIDSELMSREFVKAVLCKMVDEADIRGEPKE